MHDLVLALKNIKYQELNTQLLNPTNTFKTKVLIQDGATDTHTTEYRENTVKFTQMWDIISRKKTDYKRFVTGSFDPLLESLGIHIAGEWEVLIGDGPRIIYEGRAYDMGSLIGNLQSNRFRAAKKELKHYIENYESRLLTFHLQKKRIQNRKLSLDIIWTIEFVRNHLTQQFV